jgi:hypothetical protein
MLFAAPAYIALRNDVDEERRIPIEPGGPKWLSPTFITAKIEERIKELQSGLAEREELRSNPLRVSRRI